jgi:hypothetical protein
MDTARFSREWKSLAGVHAVAGVVGARPPPLSWFLPPVTRDQSIEIDIIVVVVLLFGGPLRAAPHYWWRTE